MFYLENNIFSDEQKSYAYRVVEFFDPQDKFFTARLYRDSCTLVDNVYVKDLNSLGRPLTSTIIVDNSIHAFACNITNGVPIPSYYGQPWDNEL